MVEPWPVTQHPDAPEMWIVEDDSGKSGWLDEQSARRYAALRVLLALVRKVCSQNPCAICECYEGHFADCDGIAALKAAGEGL